VGIYLNAHFTEVWFNRLVYSILLLTGVQLMVGRSAIAALFG
jgi:hypothetical protein